MSGHSKWSQIKRKKGIKDQQKGQLFSKIARLITLTVLDGGGMTDPEHNIRLRMAIEKAKEANMPKENIKRAIEKGTGPDKEQLHEVIYEAFGPKGVVFLIQATTDNPNRTINEIKKILERVGGKIGNQGAVSYLFRKCAIVTFNKKENKEEDVFSLADKIQAFDIDEDENLFSVYFPFENLGKVKDAEVDYKPTSYVKIDNQEDARKILNLMEALEEQDDVQKVFSNFDIPDKFLIS